ncbi:MAG TPA: PLP-dependent aminotransferase family protein [bacterium]|nr:PLP-dependent aminotransferase family protein [bacterium]
MKLSAPVSLVGLQLHRDSATPLHRQLYDGLRQAILAGQLVSGARLPSTRSLADILEISRNTVLLAYDQLLIEGYVHGKVGAGTYVTNCFPDGFLRPHLSLPPGGPGRAPSRRGRILRRLGQRRTTASNDTPLRPFRTGVPALDVFPWKLWGRLLARRWRSLSPSLVGGKHPLGYRPLRELVAAYLRDARGLFCTSDQVILVGGSQQGLDLAARVLLEPGAAVWVENPGYPGAHGLFRAAGARLIPVSVDAEGLDVTAAITRCAHARLAFVTPSHQFPLGATMGVARRLLLLQWAGEHNAWILEDDYNSEYRYRGQPLPALQGLDRKGRVIYLGTFSKVLFPGLRLGYLVVPSDLIDAFSRASFLTGYYPPIPNQAVLADFIAEGHFGRHIRRTRSLYEERQGRLVEAAKRWLTDLLEVDAAEAGMHLVGRLVGPASDAEAAQRCASQGIDVTPLSVCCVEKVRKRALLLGYAAFDERAIVDGVQRMAVALRPDDGKPSRRTTAASPDAGQPTIG